MGESMKKRGCSTCIFRHHYDCAPEEPECCKENDYPFYQVDERLKKATQNKPSLQDNPLDKFETLDESREKYWKENISKCHQELSKNAEENVKERRRRNIETAKLSKTYTLGEKKLKRANNEKEFAE